MTATNFQINKTAKGSMWQNEDRLSSEEGCYGEHVAQRGSTVKSRTLLRGAWSTFNLRRRLGEHPARSHLYIHLYPPSRFRVPYESRLVQDAPEVSVSALDVSPLGGHVSAHEAERAIVQREPHHDGSLVTHHPHHAYSCRRCLCCRNK